MRRILAALAAVAVAGVLLTASVGGFGDGTDTASLVVRGMAGLAVGGVLIVFVRRTLRSMAEPPPAPPERLDARQTDVVYECGVCATRVRLEVATTGKAPKHCGETMEPSLA